MTKLWILFKNTFINKYSLNNFSIKNMSNKDRLKSVRKSLLALFIFVYLIGIIVVYGFLGLKYLSKVHMETLLISIFAILTIVGIFFMSIFNAKSNIFNAKDNDVLFSMPIKPFVIFINKLLGLLFSNYLVEFVIFLPILVIYAIKIPVGITYYIYSFISILFLPFIPVALSAAFGYIVAIISSKFKRKALVETVINFLLIFLIWLISFNLKGILKKMFADMSKVNDIISKIFYPIDQMQKAIINSDFKALIIFVLINVLVFGIFTIILNLNYKNILLRLQENKTGSKYVQKTVKTYSVDKSLFLKELKTYISLPIYILNTAFGPIVIFIGSLLAIILGENKVMNLLGFNEALQAGYFSIFNILVIIFAFVIVTANTTCSSISLEGKSLWILKTIPLTEKQIFKSKILVNVFVALPLTIVSTILISFAFKITLLQFLMLILMEIILTFMISLLGIITNLMYPKLDFKNPAQVVKQGFSAFIALFSGFALLMIIGFVYMKVNNNISFNLFYLLTMLLFIGISLIEYIVINSWGVKKLHKLT